MSDPPTLLAMQLVWCLLGYVLLMSPLYTSCRYS